MYIFPYMKIINGRSGDEKKKTLLESRNRKRFKGKTDREITKEKIKEEENGKMKKELNNQNKLINQSADHVD